MLLGKSWEKEKKNTEHKKYDAFKHYGNVCFTETGSLFIVIPWYQYLIIHHK